MVFFRPQSLQRFILNSLPEYGPSCLSPGFQSGCGVFTLFMLRVANCCNKHAIRPPENQKPESSSTAMEQYRHSCGMAWIMARKASSGCSFTGVVRLWPWVLMGLLCKVLVKLEKQGRKSRMYVYPRFHLVNECFRVSGYTESPPLDLWCSANLSWKFLHGPRLVKQILRGGLRQAKYAHEARPYGPPCLLLRCFPIAGPPGVFVIWGSGTS